MTASALALAAEHKAKELDAERCARLSNSSGFPCALRVPPQSYRTRTLLRRHALIPLLLARRTRAECAEADIQSAMAAYAQRRAAGARDGGGLAEPEDQRVRQAPAVLCSARQCSAVSCF